MLCTMTNIIIVRHGETEWNASETFRGRRDVALNEMGIKQAQCVGEYLAEQPIEAVYSSPLKRAMDTAEQVAARQDLVVAVSEGLVDFDYGVWEGKTHSEVKAGYRELYEQWEKEPHRVRMPRGESLDEVRDRAMGVIGSVVSKHDGTVVLASHRVVNKVLVCAMLGLDNSRFWNIRQDLAGITVFSHDGESFTLVAHNDTSHLRLIQSRVLGDF